MHDLNPIFPNTTRHIAVFSDIHGNRQALDAILNDLEKKGINDVVCNGDLITSSAQSAYVVNRIHDLAIPTTRGNHERYLLELENPHDEKWQLDNWAVTKHEFETLEPERKQWLYNLPEMLCLTGGRAPLFMTHGAPGDDRARVTAGLTEKAWAKRFKPFPANTTLIGSHLHKFFHYKGHPNQFIRTPSAGLPLDGDLRAGYCLLKQQDDAWTVEECRVAYDLEKELQDFKNSEFYAAGGVFLTPFMARA